MTSFARRRSARASSRSRAATSDVDAGIGQRPGERLADPARCPGDDGGPPRMLHQSAHRLNLERRFGVTRRGYREPHMPSPRIEDYAFLSDTRSAAMGRDRAASTG